MFRFPKFRMNYTISGESGFELNKDIKEAKTCFQNAAYKATMVLCGSILEHALLDYLLTDDYLAEQAYIQVFAPRRVPTSLENWILDEMLQVSRRLSLLSDETYRLCDLLRNYRNLIHPAVSRHRAIKPNRTRALRSLEATRQALQELDANFVSSWQQVFIINISNIPTSFINNKSNIQTAVANIAQQQGMTVNVVSTFRGIRALLQNPPKYAVVVNTHGEIMPVPRGIGWRNFYIEIGKVVNSHGWIFVGIGGYPFWYQRQNQPVRGDGLNAFLSVNGISANCMNPVNVNFTREGTEVIHRANMTGLPHTLLGIRCARW